MHRSQRWIVVKPGPDSSARCRAEANSMSVHPDLPFSYLEAVTEQDVDLYVGMARSAIHSMI